MSADTSIRLRRPPGLTVVAVLAIVQAGFELALAVVWLRYGTQLEGRGLLLLPILSLLFVLRGVIAAVLGALYVLFARGAFARSDWAWWLGLCLAVCTTLGTVGLIVAGEPLALAVTRAIIPLILLGYLLSPPGRAALTPLAQ
jgi:lysylphosphatidylglycerol synthetase-like protein (DUF2156 family)